MKKRYISVFTIIALMISIFSSFSVVSANDENTCIATMKYNGHTYKLYNKNTSWLEAEKFCENLGGHLATITSEKENEAIYEFLEENDIRDVYLGAADVVNEGDWFWITGEKWSFEKWADGEPNNQSNDEHYLMFYYRTGDCWNDGDGRVNYFLCEVDNLLTDAKKNTNNIILAEAETFNGNYYKIYDNRMNWYDAKAYCESLGGHLVTITSQEEQTFIESLLKDYNGDEFFIGLHRDLDNFGTWVTGEKVKYANWGEGEPDNAYGGQETGVIATNHSDAYSDVGHYIINKYQWDDNSDRGRSFICEWEADKITIIINGNKIIPQQEPVIINGTTLVHIRTFENVGASVDWDNDTQTATVKKGNKIVKAQIGKAKLNINGVDTPYVGVVPTQLINDCTMVPLRAIIEAMGGVVNWNGQTKIIDIYYSDIIDYIIENSDKKSNLVLMETDLPDARRIFSYYEYCYDYMEKYYDDEFLTAFSIAFDDPTMPIKTLVESIFDFTNMPDYRNPNKNIDLSAVYTKNNVAECLANAINGLIDEELELYTVNSDLETVISKINSVTGLVLSNNSELESLSVFSNVLKGMSGGIKVINSSSEILEDALADYGMSYTYLESFEAALNDSGLMNETLKDTITKLKAEYSSWFIKHFESIVTNTVSGKVIDAAADLAGKGTYSFVNFVWEGLNIASDNNDRAELLKKINSYMIYSLPLSRSYTYYADKIFSGNYTTHDVLQCERIFDLCKETRISEYKCVASLDKVDRVNYKEFMPERINELGIVEEKMLRDGISLLENISYKKK